MTHNVPNRRGFLGAAIGAAAGLLVPAIASAQLRDPRVLRFNHTYTGEKLAIEYWSAGTYEPQGLDAINRLMRDFRTGEIYPIDPSLLDLLHDVARRTESNRPFEIISAYRSPKTNAALNSHSDGVARNSLHLRGKAIDIRLGDVALPDLRRAALAQPAGTGVCGIPQFGWGHVGWGRVVLSAPCINGVGWKLLRTTGSGVHLATGWSALLRGRWSRFAVITQFFHLSTGDYTPCRGCS